MDFKTAPQRDNEVKFFALVCAGIKVSEVGKLVKVSRTTVSAIKKRTVNRRAGSCRKTAMDRDSLPDAIRGTASNGIPQAVTTHNSLSTTACTFVDTFTIFHVLLGRVDGCARPTRFTTSVTLCSVRRSADISTRLSLCGAIFTLNKKTFSLMSQPQSTGRLSKRRIIMPNSKIVTKSFVQFLSAHLE